MAKQCQNCKNSLTERAKFCRMCGTPTSINQILKNSNGELSNPKPETKLPVAELLISKAESLSAQKVVAPSTTKKKSISVVQIAKNFSANLIAPPTNALVGSFEQAGFRLRLGAFMLDLILMLMLMLFITLIATKFISYQAIINKIGLVVVIGGWIYNFLILASIKGQTIGKQLVGIRIISVDQSRAKASQIIIRHTFGYFIATIAFALGFLWLLWDRKQQGWHDKLAKTLVIKKRFS
ncbi:MAG: RDD family protein [Acidobacteria bacterium]|nr:RDD family protein [Acidobacteriota bacterium]